MCLAFPGKIVSLEGENATVDFGGTKKEIMHTRAKRKRCSYIDSRVMFCSVAKPIHGKMKREQRMLNTITIAVLFSSSSMSQQDRRVIKTIPANAGRKALRPAR